MSLIRSPHALFHSGNQFSVIAGLKQVVQCPDGNRSFRVRKLVKRSQENNAACRAHRADLLGGFKARDARHLDIQNQDICRILLIKRDDFSSVSGLAQTDAVTEIFLYFFAEDGSFNDFVVRDDNLIHFIPPNEMARRDRRSGAEQVQGGAA